MPVTRRFPTLTIGELCGFLLHPQVTLNRWSATTTPTATDAIHELLPKIPFDDVEALRTTFLKEKDFFGELTARSVEHRKRYYIPDRWFEAMYLLIRLVQPEVMVETGVFDGNSTAVILFAMHQNNAGRLLSIDLPRPPVDDATPEERVRYGLPKKRRPESVGFGLPPGCDPGWLVPDWLRDRHELRLGDARELLPIALKELGEVDVFFHDSNHTYAHQRFEYETAWPYVKPGGWLLSDDMYWSLAYTEFARRQQLAFTHYNSLGILRKPG